jgi:putative salt-induced outer membrane protein YdiY
MEVDDPHRSPMLRDPWKRGAFPADGPRSDPAGIGPSMRAWALAIGLLMGASASSARAQVNIEPMRKKLAERGYSGTLEASWVVRTGNTEGVVANGVGQVGWANDRHLFFVTGRADYSRLNDELQLSRTFLHARYNLTVVHRFLFAELFSQAQTDATLNLRARELVGAGPRFALSVTPEHAIYAGLAAMLEHEKWSVPEGAPDDPDTLYWRASSYASVTFTPDNQLTFSVVGLFQPRVTRFHDFRVLVESLFDVAIRKGFSLRISSTYRYDNEPITGVKSTDVEVRNAIAWSY